ncbi:GNAT family N-acetyltransferase [Knoellia locipacati]|uniref:GNAT family N-acetyltransferase n=1 Tax=Knoellia locipacati TaxID=882824 RepID=UPI00384BA1B2
MSWRIVPVTMLDPDPSAAGLARTWHQVFIDSAVAAMGDDHDVWSMDSRRAHEQYTSWSHRYFGALDGNGELVAAGELVLSLRDNPQLAFVDVAVHPDRRREGGGTALLDHLEREARRQDRDTLHAETTVPAGGTDGGDAFLRRHGFALGQTMQRNDLDLGVDAAEATSEGDPGRVIHPTADETPGYVIETSCDDTLGAWLDDRAVLQQRMSTDSPVGDLDLREEAWDAERLREQRLSTRRSNRRAIESVARHVESGRLVAFTQLQIPTADPVLAYQQDTLVLREHRGHGLGAAVKAANMRALRAEFPQTRTVRTWNAEENGPMIRVNEALGYRTTALQREWQRRLA